MNSILGNNPLIQTLVMASKMRNPEQMLNQLVMNNPQFNDVITDYKNSGKTSREYFEDKARIMGIDPNEIISMLK